MSNVRLQTFPDSYCDMANVQHPRPLPSEIASGYERDLVAWALENAALLREGRFNEIDAAHIAEELEDLGKSERRALASHLRNLLMHLLKWQYQPDLRSGSWRSPINNTRAEIAEILEDSPSLRPIVSQGLEKGYGLARKNAIAETGLAPDIFPEANPYSIEQVLSDEFWPGDPP